MAVPKKKMSRSRTRRRKAAWKVLPAGYYRLAAHSLFGTRLWGPRDRYLPGPVTLQSR